MSEDLQQIRAQIDAIDEQVLTLINQRARHAQTIGRLKNGTVYRPEREAQVLRRIKELNLGPLADETAARLFREIMSACLALEKPLSVAFLGPQGTFSQAAAIKQFGHAAETRSCASIDEVFSEVNAGGADYGIVPVENSTEGAVNRTLDLLQDTPLKICGEVDLRIHQSLLRKISGLDGVKVIYSHGQSLAQCHEWLNRHLPGVPRVQVASNAEAAQMAAADEAALAVAGDIAAEIYGLQRLFDNIEDEPNNTTRFLVLGKHDAAISGHDKTSLVMSALNLPGTIVELLQPFARHGISLTKLESRPARSGLWEYVFFVDIEGHRDDPAVAAALSELAARAAFLKLLGSYPIGVL
ncbi:chorismate mutase [Sulfuriferula sp. AH1]|uniref:prephenate dehydratase n=1 Tax=Sulfuriferula sp. AH1 TaxID=1985873 RepID=UPI000B3B9071|nr:prephenate dehydratase [Sulfuriferula sp. AH1]ARU31967.1 chorismate mutase [Sulfuriferula sp. AH1]